MEGFAQLLHRAALLRHRLVGRALRSDRVRQPAALCLAIHGNLSVLQGRRLEGLIRKSHFLVLRFEGFDLAVSPAPAATLELAAPEDADPVSLAFALEFGDENPVELRCLVGRTRGAPLAWLIASGDWRSVPGLHTSGVDVQDRRFTPERLASLLKHSGETARALILSHRALDSLGPEDADTVLIEAGIHPGAPSRSLSRDEAFRLHAAIARLVQAALDSAEAERPPPAPARLATCPRCGGELRSLAQRAGEARLCPRCQPPRGRR
jgi:formamidopyrimidine-DNA glycosylase